MSLIRLRKCMGETASSLFAIRYIFDRRKTLFSLAQNDTHTTQHTHTHAHTQKTAINTPAGWHHDAIYILFNSTQSCEDDGWQCIAVCSGTRYTFKNISASIGNRTASSVDKRWAARAPHHTPEKCYSLRMYVSDILNVPNKSFLIERDEKISVNSRVRSTSENLYIFNMRLCGKRVFFFCLRELASKLIFSLVISR